MMFITFHVTYGNDFSSSGNTELPIEDFNGIKDIRDAEDMIEQEFNNNNVYDIKQVVITSWKRFGT